MKARIEWRGQALSIDFSRGRSLAIELDPSGKHPSFFSDRTVHSEPLRLGGFVGDMKQGGSCNAQVITFSPHSHGTHTECIGHIDPQHQAVTATVDQRPTLLQLVTVQQEAMDGRSMNSDILDAVDLSRCGALAIRTLPNDESKRNCRYDDGPEFPVLSHEAMHKLCESQIMHLLLDTPSLDHPDSQGLENHSMWWGKNPNVTPGVPQAAARSVTEMIFVPDDIPDGAYWLDLQLAPFVSDAVPSRPIIYPVQPLEAAEEGTQA